MVVEWYPAAIQAVFDFWRFFQVGRRLNLRCIILENKNKTLISKCLWRQKDRDLS